MKVFSDFYNMWCVDLHLHLLISPKAKYSGSTLTMLNHYAMPTLNYINRSESDLASQLFEGSNIAKLYAKLLNLGLSKDNASP